MDDIRNIEIEDLAFASAHAAAHHHATESFFFKIEYRRAADAGYFAES